MESFSSQDITNFLKQFIEIGPGYRVDEKSIVHSIDLVDKKDEVYMIPSGTNPPRQIKVSIYDVNQQDPDTIICNPFAEGLQTSDELLWFYTYRNLTMSTMICRIVNQILSECIKVNKSKEADSHSPEIARLISPFVELVDEKMPGEFRIMYENMSNFINIYWDKKKGLCSFRVGIFEETFRKSFGKRIRQKTWDNIAKIFTHIFGTDNVKETYRMKSTNQGYARIECYSQVFLMLLKAINPYLILVKDIDPIDIPTFEMHVSKIPLYYARAKFVYTSNVNKAAMSPAPQAAPTPWSTNRPTSVTDMIPEPGVDPNTGAHVGALAQNPVAGVAPTTPPAPVQMQQAPAEYIPPPAQYPYAQQQQPMYAPQPQYGVPPQGYNPQQFGGYPNQQMPMQPQGGMMSVGHMPVAPVNPMMQQPGMYPQPGAVMPGMSGVPFQGYDPRYIQPQPQYMMQQPPQGMPQGYNPQQFMPQGGYPPQGYGQQYAPQQGMQLVQPPMNPVTSVVTSSTMGLPVVMSSDNNSNRANYPGM